LRQHKKLQLLSATFVGIIRIHYGSASTHIVLGSLYEWFSYSYMLTFSMPERL